MHAKQKFLIIVSVLFIVLIIGLGMIFFLYNKNQKKIQSTNNNNINQIIKTNSNTASSNINQPVVSSNTNQPENTNQAQTALNEDEDKQHLVLTAKNFAARFGTFSNQGDFSNLEGLKSYMSADMKSWAEQYISNSRKNRKDEPYSSIKTIVTEASIVEYSAESGTAKVEANTLRMEKRQIPASEKKYEQKISISFIKENNQWRVGAANWL